MNCPHCQAGNSEHAERCAKCGGMLLPADQTETMAGTGPTAPSAKPKSVTPNIGSGVLTPTPTPAPIDDPGATLVGGSYLPAFAPGTLVGARYLIEGLLGEGGMGRVYKAYDQELDRFVALKVLQPELARDPQIIQRFKQELLLASKISHKNILRIHDLSDDGGVKFISMAFVEGEDLHGLLRRESSLPLDRALRIARQLCEALAAAHAEGVVHRDFKPQNVLVGKDDLVFVSDFGLATSVDSAKLGMTRTGAFVGTPRYMSPEQVEGGKIDHRSDLYSLGLVLYELVTGDLPFTGQSTWQLMYQRVKEKPKDPKSVRPDLPDWVSRIVLHCLERDPDVRYQSATEILADIDANRSPAGARRTHPAAKWVIAAGLLVTVAGAGYFLMPRVSVKVPAVTFGTSGLPPLSKGKFVAILPFRTIGGDGAQNYIAEGLNEALATKLFGLNDLHMTPVSEAAKQNDQTTPLPKIAKELGVNMIVQGTVQVSENQIQILVKLNNMETNQVDLNKEFRTAQGDLLTTQDQIYQALLDAMSTKVSDAERVKLMQHPTENVEAYNDYMKGRNALTGNANEKNVQAAINYFNSALEKDKAFALAYTGLADANLMLYQEKKDKYWSEKALEAAKKAAQLNDKLPEVHSALGNAYSAMGQIALAIEEDKKALELAPNSDEAYRRLGNAYRANGQKAEALQALEKAVDINPYYWNNLAALGNAYVGFGDVDKAAKLYEKVIQVEPDNPAGYSNLGMVYFSQGKYQESIDAFQKALKIAPSAEVYTNLGTAYFYLQRYDDSVQMMEKAVQLNPGDTVLMGNLADGYRRTGKTDLARKTYEQAIRLGFNQLKVNPRDTTILGSMALFYAKTDDTKSAREFVKQARAMDRSDVYLIYIEAVVDTIDKKPGDAVKALNTALEKGFSLSDVEVDPEFALLASRPDYQAMVKKYGAKKK